MTETAPKQQEGWPIIGIAFVAVSASIGWLWSHGSPDMAWSLNHQIFADNRTTTTLCLLLAAAWLFEVGNGKPVHQTRRKIGLIIFLFGLAAHREMWSWWRWYLALGDETTALYIRDHLAWVTSLMQLTQWVGLSVMASVFAENYFGSSRAVWLVVMGCMGVWATWFLIAAWFTS